MMSMIRRFAVFLCVSASAGAQELGTISFPTSASAAAQAEFVRGVLWLHNFGYPPAAAAFRRAQAIEPKFAMAYWGEALTYTHQVWNQQDTASGRAALRRLAPTRDARLALAPTPRERAYLAAVEALYGDGPKARRDTLYAAAMEQVTHQWPDDDEAAVLYANALLGLSQGLRDVPTYMRAGAIAQDVFRRNANHPGAVHMVIHSFDDPVHAPLGLYAARMYSSVAPSSPHALHMTTHIFLELGMWREVVSQNIAASGPDTSRWQPGHSTTWLLYGYLQQGRFEEARKLLASLSAHARSQPELRGYVANNGARYVIDTERWDSPEAHSLDADVGAPGEDGYEYGVFTAGYAAAKRGDRARATALLTQMAKRNGSATRAIKPGAAGVKATPVILELSLRAELARLNGKVDSAIALLATRRRARGRHARRIRTASRRRADARVPRCAVSVGTSVRRRSGAIRPSARAAAWALRRATRQRSRRSGAWSHRRGVARVPTAGRQLEWSGRCDRRPR